MRFNNFLDNSYIDYEIKNNQLHFKTEGDALFATDFAHYVEVVDHGRWNIHKRGVLQEEETGRYFEIEWYEAATEYQESSMNTVFDEVFPVERKVVIVEWEKKTIV